MNVQHDAERVRQAIDGLADLVREIRVERSSSSVNINAGGFGLWAAVTACLVMLAANGFMIAALVYIGVRQENQGHQLNAIYMIAPEIHDRVKEYLKEQE